MTINPNVLISQVGNDVVGNEATERDGKKKNEKKRDGRKEKNGKKRDGKKEEKRDGRKEEKWKGKPVVNTYNVKESFATLSEYLLVFVGNVIPSPGKDVKGRMILFTGK